MRLTTEAFVDHIAARVSEKVAAREPWLDKRGVAQHFACSVRSIELAMADGMPHALIFGRAKFRVAECEGWLQESGRLRPHGEVGSVPTKPNGAATGDTAPPHDREVSPDGTEA
jgi:hypothetical protein